MGYLLLSWNYGRNVFWNQIISLYRLCIVLCTEIQNDKASNGDFRGYRYILSHNTFVFFLSYKPHMSLDITYSLERVKCRRQTAYKGINFFFFVHSQDNLTWRRWHLSKTSNFLTLELKKFLCSDYTINMESFFRICSEFDCYSITYMFNFVPFSLQGVFRSHKIQC